MSGFPFGVIQRRDQLPPEHFPGVLSDVSAVTMRVRSETNPEKIYNMEVVLKGDLTRAEKELARVKKNYDVILDELQAMDLRAKALVEAAENLENDDGRCPANLWKQLQDAIALNGGKRK